MDLSLGQLCLIQGEKDCHCVTGPCIICAGIDHFMAVCLICRNDLCITHATLVSIADGTQVAEWGKFKSLA